MNFFYIGSYWLRTKKENKLTECNINLINNVHGNISPKTGMKSKWKTGNKWILQNYWLGT